jgi:hypothetical protein
VPREVGDGAFDALGGDRCCGNLQALPERGTLALEAVINGVSVEVGSIAG